MTEDPPALRRWMVDGPEISRLVANYETVSGTKDAKKNNRHHEQTETVQISCQNRQCDLQEFFKHENQSFPASLSNKGKLHTCTKSDLVDVLQAKVTLPEARV